MDGRYKLIVMLMSMLLVLSTNSTAQKTDSDDSLEPCAKLKNFKASNKIATSIMLTWNIPNRPQCQKNITGYNITFGTIGEVLRNTFWENENKINITGILSDLIPDRQYMIVIIVNYNNNEKTIKRPRIRKSGIANSAALIPIAPSSSNHIMPTPTTVSTESKSVNGAAVAGGVVAFVLVILMVVVALISVWLIKRRKKLLKKSGPHYISVVSGIGGESTLERGQLYSRPGYLQIVHDVHSFGYEIPRNSVNLTPRTTLPSHNEIEYPRRELQGGCANSNSSINSVQVTIEPIQTASVSAVTNDPQVIQGKKKLVKPYAIVDVKDITVDMAFEEMLSRHKAKHKKHKEFPCNREALEKSFNLCSDVTTTQAEQSPSNTLKGRYYTVPIYVNLNIPMTVNPSYNKNKV